MRKMVLLFNKMTFGQVLRLTTLLKAYLYEHSNTDLDMQLDGYVLAAFNFIASAGVF